jgi:hypothetical protein
MLGAIERWSDCNYLMEEMRKKEEVFFLQLYSRLSLE